MIDFPGLIRFVFFKGIKNAHPLRSAPSRQVCISVNSAKRVAMERRRKFRSRRPRVKEPAGATSDSALMVIVVYHSCLKKSSKKCRGGDGERLGQKGRGCDFCGSPRRRPCSPPRVAASSARPSPDGRYKAASTSNRSPSQTPGSDTLCYSRAYGPSTKWSTCWKQSN